ncbi:MAG: FAD-dependent oxidoreductase [Bryobacteraceae bacterium]|jgi:sarcosine oxidase subunit beta
MSETADVVIIGGGIVGSSVAWHLNAAGCRNVLVIERESQQGLGSTGKSMGGVRAQFDTAVNIRMSLYSIPIFAAFEEITGRPSEYKSHGYLFVATTPRHLDYLRGNYERQVALGLKAVEMLTREEIIHRVPQLRNDDILGGSFCATDGFVDPYSVMKGFMASALEQGTRLWRNVEVTAIDVDARGVSGVRTSNGTVAARTVVNAAGPWAAAVARMAGVDLPIVPLRRMLVPTEPFPGLPERLPMVIDMSTGFHFRPEGRGLLMAWNDPAETPGFKTAFDPAFIERILTHAVDRVPCFENLEVNPHRAWAGLYAVSPDHHAIIGPAPGVPGLFFANGFSGHGVMHSPATGRITADLILHGATDLLDARELNMERFQEGRMLEETAVL